MVDNLTVFGWVLTLSLSVCNLKQVTFKIFHKLCIYDSLITNAIMLHSRCLPYFSLGLVKLINLDLFRLIIPDLQ